MNLFLSWSKDRSQAVAEAFHEWIQCVNQKIIPFFSPKDLSGGIVWINELNTQLAKTNAGIIFLTPENQHEPWIQFEAGALAKGFSANRVFVLLIDLEPHQVEGPLSNFNLSKSDEDGIKKLILNLNDLLEENKVSHHILNKVVDKYYPDLQLTINNTIAKRPIKEETAKRSSADIQNEMLTILRSLSNRVASLEKRTGEEKLVSDYNSAILADLAKNENAKKLSRFYDIIRENRKTLNSNLSFQEDDGSSSSGGI
ncbi:hypothetical protein J0A68_00500 [Algoriphagus sp. H41]|uniref:TIR domain-containing protein n=1 Tax=Algoriphagus oliviformis TaxID=2811231 RepID=A0ABS3BYC3_9BACT|nr:hypothetical protein [Algoriphagus oliviformis]MBN7809411.1 hypothetical protein [Algoriphagus oliviformis]